VAGCGHRQPAVQRPAACALPYGVGYLTRRGPAMKISPGTPNGSLPGRCRRERTCRVATSEGIRTARDLMNSTRWCASCVFLASAWLAAVSGSPAGAPGTLSVAMPQGAFSADEGCTLVPDEPSRRIRQNG